MVLWAPPKPTNIQPKKIFLVQSPSQSYKWTYYVFHYDLEVPRANEISTPNSYISVLVGFFHHVYMIVALS